MSSSSSSRTRVARRSRQPKSRGLDAASFLVTIPRGLTHTPMPPRLRTTLVVHTANTLGANLGGANYNAYDLMWKGNCMYQVGPAANYPLGTLSAYVANYPSGMTHLTGSDPAGGESTGIYKNYFVHGSKITIQVVPLTGGPVECILLPTNNQNAQTTITNQLAEQTFAKRYVLPPTLAGRPQQFAHALSTRQVLGLAHLDSSYAQFNCTYNGAPTVPWFWQLRFNNLDQTTTTYTCAWRCTIEYDVEFFDINTLSTAAPA